MSEAKLLQVDNLRVRFNTDDGVVNAVDGASYSVGPGQTLGIVGESGSGKSVSSLTALGLTRGPRTTVEGSMTFEGRDLVTMETEELRRVRGNDIAMIFQDPLSALHPFYTVGAQLTEAVLAHQDLSKSGARDRALEMMSLVGIPDPKRRLTQYPHEFSGGMRQRVMIAMALLNEPKLLIADEPTTALDVTVQAQILALLEDLQSRLGMAIIIITHDLGVVAGMADEIAVMYAGRIVEHSATREIFNNPQHPYTWGLLKSIPRLDTARGDELSPISGRPPSLINRPSGCHFHPRCPYVQESHKRIDPRLEPVAAGRNHAVACLLSAETRQAIWQGLQRADPLDQLQRIAAQDASGDATGANGSVAGPSGAGSIAADAVGPGAPAAPGTSASSDTPNDPGAATPPTLPGGGISGDAAPRTGSEPT